MKRSNQPARSLISGSGDGKRRIRETIFFNQLIYSATRRKYSNLSRPAIQLLSQTIVILSIGMLVKFVWGWLPLIFGLINGFVIGFLGGWLAAAIGFFIILCSVFLTNTWHGTNIFLSVEEAIEKIFSLDD